MRVYVPVLTCSVCVCTYVCVHAVCVCVRTCTCIHSTCSVYAFCICIILCKCLTGIADLIGSSWSDRLHPIPTLQPFQLTQGPVHSLPLTNLYAEQRQRVKPDRRWYPTTPEEMRAFIGINVMMGIDRKPEVHLGNAGIQAVLPRDHFESLTRYLHHSHAS